MIDFVYLTNSAAVYLVIHYLLKAGVSVTFSNTML